MAYTVRSGENLTRIARSLGTTVDELVRLNNISDPDLIFAGQELVVPGGDAPAAEAPAAPSAAPAPTGNASSVEGQRAKGRSAFGAVDANFRGTGQQVMGPRAGDGDKTPAPIPPGNPDRTAAAAMYDVGMGGAPAPVIPPTAEQPVAGDGMVDRQFTQPTGRTSPGDAYLAQSRGVETALARQQADEPQRIAEQNARWQERDPGPTPVAAAMTTAAPAAPRPVPTTRPGADPYRQTMVDAGFMPGMRDDFNRDGYDNLPGAVNPPGRITAPEGGTDYRPPTAVETRALDPVPLPNTARFRPNINSVGPDALNAQTFANMTREQLMAVDPTTLTREQWAEYDAALQRLLGPGV